MRTASALSVGLLVYLAACTAKHTQTMPNSPSSNPENKPSVAWDGNADTSLRTFQGRLLKKPWTKTGESYCAGGSEYWVLEGNTGTLVLAFDENFDPETLTHLAEKGVSILGRLEDRTITPDANGPISQHPVTGLTNNAYTCTVLRVIRFKP
jgi:hypothetical protein